jgi:hypothetical protein
MFKLIGTITNSIISVITLGIEIILPFMRAGKVLSEGVEKSVIIDDEDNELDRMKRRAANKAAYAEYQKQLAAEPTISPADLKAA